MPDKLKITMNLDGDWDFAYRPDAVVTPGSELPPAQEFAATMPVPGYWDDHLPRLRVTPGWSAARFNPEYKPVEMPMGHFPPEEYLQAADELGMMVQVEPASQFTETEWVEILKTCRSHPSVVIYCTGNEEWLDDPKIEFLKRCASRCKEFAPDALFNAHEALRGVEYGWESGAPLDEGTVSEPYPHNPRRFPHDGYFDWQFYSMLEGGYAIVFNELPTDFAPIFDVVSSFKLIYKQANLFEIKVARGRLLVASMRIDRRDPATAGLLEVLIAYARSDEFQPRARIEAEQIARWIAVNRSLPVDRSTDEALDPQVSPTTI
ncbi:MAG: hypothetical protein HY360_27340 [Verrucomicrobia bacterium]|nr:hypothetical protein [Verrucomicrobiota bacterium]